MEQGGDQRRLGFRRAVHRALDPGSGEGRISPLNLFLAAVIILSVAMAVIETEASLIAGRQAWFKAAEIGFGVIFLVEYAARIIAAPEDYPHLPAWKARLRWMVSPFAIIDLLALVPLLFVMQAAPTVVLRLIRLLRILRLAKLGRTSHALTLVVDVFTSRRYELGVTAAIGAMLLVVVSTLLYLVEGRVQPEAFGSIPRALWWGVITLTTIGYGDVHPVTALGKVLAGLTAVIGIGLVAAPTGILATGFAEALREERERGDK